MTYATKIKLINKYTLCALLINLIFLLVLADKKNFLFLPVNLRE